MREKMPSRRSGKSLESRVENPMFGFPHMQASPYTVSQGRLILGTDVAFGVTDFLQVGTNLIRNFYKAYNANARLSLIDFPEFALSLTYGFEHVNLRRVDNRNPDVSIRSHQPGVVTAYGLAQDLALFIGANLNYRSFQIRSGEVPVSSGFLRGAQVGSDLAWNYSRTARKFGNVISVGSTYDLSYSLIGLGISHHWPGFRIGIHYYPNATENRLLPLIAGGAVVDL
jgi:hypothetical protein